MAEMQSKNHWHVQSLQSFQNQRAQIVRRLGGLRAADHFSKNNPSDLAELSGSSQMKQHAVNPVRFLVNVFQKQNGPPSVKFLPSPEYSGQDNLSHLLIPDYL